MESAARAAVEVTVGASGLAWQVAAAVGRRARPVVGSLAAVPRHAPVPQLTRPPRRLVTSLQNRGARRLHAGRRELSALLDRLVPLVLEEVLRRADPTALILRYVDLDAIAAHLDLDAVAARLDADAVAARLDVDAVARRLDLDAVLDRVDVDAVARRLDVEAVLDRLDLTDVVLRRVKLDVLVQAVLDRVDLAGLAEQVIKEVDLPEIIRESTGTMASGTVRDARMQAILADEAVSRVRARLRLRRGSRPDALGPGSRPVELPAQRGPED